MSGHSKWSQIKHKKAIADTKKGAAFSKLVRAISVAARGNPDPAANLRLRTEIERARAANMPLDVITRTLQRASDAASAELNDVQLEYIGPGGVAVLVHAITDNTNRTINELRQIASRHNVRGAGLGAIAWIFKRVGIFHIPRPFDELVPLSLIDAGADDVTIHDDELLASADPSHFEAVQRALNGRVHTSSIEYLPTQSQAISENEWESLQKFLDALEDHDDVQDVVTNATEQ